MPIRKFLSLNSEKLSPDFSSSTVLCVGDVMLDRFIYGDVERVSPEAPVPVMRIKRDFSMVGGAGNVVNNLSSLGAQVIFISVVGDDDTGKIIEEHFQKLPNVTTKLFIEEHRKTSLKTRFIAQSQQLLRVDDEVISACSAQTEDQIAAFFHQYLSKIDVLILSDYGKGLLSSALCQAIITEAKGKIPIIVDPKGRHYNHYSGATLITPNLKEMCDVVGHSLQGDAEVLGAANKLREKFDIESVLVTQGSAGMLLVDNQGQSHKIHARAQEVFDVSGAGDTVVATLAASLAQKIPLVESSHLANIAAGIVVGKVGTAAVTINELKSSLQGSNHIETSKKIMSLSDIAQELKKWRHQGLRIGFTNGCFDLLHLGHIHLLQQSAKGCDKLIVGLNSDVSVKRLKGDTRPIQSEEVRSQVLAALSTVAAVIIFDEETPFKLIKDILPDVLIKGADYTVDQVVGADIVQAHGGQVMLVNLQPGHSTTATVAKLKAIS